MGVRPLLDLFEDDGSERTVDSINQPENETAQAEWYVDRAKVAGAECGARGSQKTYYDQYETRNIEDTWTEGRAFTLSAYLPDGPNYLISPPIWSNNTATSRQYVYIVVLLRSGYAGVITFQLFRYQIKPERQQYYEQHQEWYRTHPVSTRVPSFQALGRYWEPRNRSGGWDPAPEKWQGAAAQADGGPIRTVIGIGAGVGFVVGAVGLLASAARAALQLLDGGPSPLPYPTS